MLKGVRLATFTRKDGSDTKFMLWLIDVPNMLDPSQLMVEAEPMKRELPRERFFRAVMWKIFLGTILAIYVSLNPLLLESLGIVQVFSVLGVISVIIPIIFPWFALLTLRARIPGVTRDLELFNCIRSRILQTSVALGTIVVFIRLALQEQGLDKVINSFVSYCLILGIFATYFAFVYLNFFESDLARETGRRYRGLG